MEKEKINILLVEDDGIQADFVKKLLADDDYKVKIINDGREAFNYLKSHTEPDIVLLDNHLPSMTGVEIISRLKTENHQHAIIFVSADADIQVVIKAMREGALDFIVKSSPTFKDEIKNVIKKVFALQIRRQQKLEYENRIRQSEENYRNLVSEIDDFLFILDQKGTIIDVNNSLLKRLDYEKNAILGHHLTLLHPPEYKKEIETIIGQMFSGELKTYCIPLYTSKHVSVQAETRIHRSVWNGQNVLLGISKDMTGLKYSEERLRIAMKGGNNGLWDWDFTTGEYFLTSSAYEMLGYTRFNEKSTIEKWDELIHPDDISASKMRLFSHIDGQTEYYETESRIRKADGSFKWILTRGKIIERDENGQPTRMMGVIMDIDKLKAMERELLKAKSDAENANISKSRFLANMSHEIRTPMTGILGIAKLLKETNLDPSQKEYLDAITTSADNLLMIINDILDFSKINEGKLQLNPGEFSITKLVKDACKSLNNIALDKGLELKYSVDESIDPVLVGDALRLNQVLVNLIGNALKFTHKGYVEIRISLLGKENDLDHIRFTVTDTGIGIEKDKLNQIFNLFTQEDESVSRKYGGTGLGLAISKQLVDLMGGTIYVESLKNEGSKFYFSIRLPRGTSGAISEESPDKYEKMDLSHIRVLVAEDHKVNQFYIKSMFKNWNIEPDMADNGLIAVEMVKKKKYDIIFMDKQMPEMGGIKAARTIRYKLNIDTPIIALTASALKNDRNLALNAGMNDYIAKPFYPDDLLNKMLTYVKGISATQHNKETENTSSDTALPLFNLSGLRKIFGEESDKMKEMLQMFITSTPMLWDELLKDYQAGNFKHVSEIAHQIKPTVDILEITSLKQVIRDIENMAKNQQENGNLDDSIEIFGSVMDDVYEKLKGELVNIS